MKKSIKYIIGFLLSAGLLSSCGTVVHTSRKATFAPNKVELRINVSDLNYLGESELTLSYSKYLGIFSVLDSVNGTVYDPTNVKKTRIEGIRSCDHRLQKALYKVVEEFPGAVYFQLVSNQKEVDRLFLGREVKQTVRVRAYSFK